MYATFITQHLIIPKCSESGGRVCVCVCVRRPERSTESPRSCDAERGRFFETSFDTPFIHRFWTPTSLN